MPALSYCVDIGLRTIAWQAVLTAAVPPIVLGLLRAEYGFSYGYGLGVACLALVAVRLAPALSASWLAAIGVFVHGFRLVALYLLRDLTVEGMVGGVVARSGTVENDGSLGVRRFVQPVASGAALALLMIGLLLPVYVHVVMQNRGNLMLTGLRKCCVAVGLALQWFGIFLAAAADTQKYLGKRRDPSKWLSTGLFAKVRHPNYAGELHVWLGVFLGGLPAFFSRGAAWYLLCWAFVALLGMLATLRRAAKSLDRRQEAKYTARGKDSSNFRRNVEYRMYAERTGCLAPLLGQQASPI